MGIMSGFTVVIGENEVREKLRSPCWEGKVPGCLSWKIEDT